MYESSCSINVNACKFILDSFNLHQAVSDRAHRAPFKRGTLSLVVLPSNSLITNRSSTSLRRTDCIHRVISPHPVVEEAPRVSCPPPPTTPSPVIHHRERAGQVLLLAERTSRSYQGACSIHNRPVQPHTPRSAEDPGANNQYPAS
jgi:hypothetical protein